MIIFPSLNYSGFFARNSIPRKISQKEKLESLKYKMHGFAPAFTNFASIL